MKQNYSHITLVCDRSGSMHTIQQDAEGAVNAFVDEQKEVPGEATLLLVEFDAEHGLNNNELRQESWYHVVHNGNIDDAPKYRLAARGNTALLDAIGRAISETGAFLESKSEDDRPEHVFFVVQTDGQENSSREWKLDAVRNLIKEQESQWNWQFVFLGMGPDAFNQGSSMGFSNVTRSAQAPQAYASSYGNVSNAVAGVRTKQVTNLGSTNVVVDAEGKVTPDPVRPVET